MSKLKIILPDNTEIISSYTCKRVNIDDNVIKVLSAAYPERYDAEVLTPNTYRWSISLGQDALDSFKELFKAKEIEYIPLLPGNSGDSIHFGNLYVIIDTINDPMVPQLLIAIAVFAICIKLLAKHPNDHMDRYITSVSNQIIDCITKDGYWDTDRLRRIWVVLNYTFINVLGCKFTTIDE